MGSNEMDAIYRIRVQVDPVDFAYIEDIDLSMILAHGTDGDPPFAQVLSAEGSFLQWLPSSRASAIPGQRCCTLVIRFPERRKPASPQELLIHVMAGSQEQRFDYPKGFPKIIKRRLDRPISVGPTYDILECLDRAFELVLNPHPGQEGVNDQVKIKESPDALDVSLGDKPFFTYRYNTKDPELRRPIFHPVIGPSGKTITQLGEVADKKVAHFHHTGLWIAHQNWAAKGLPNCDNWQMNKNCTKIEHVKFEAIESGPLAARFIEKLYWLDTKGEKTLLAETRTVTVPKRPAAGRIIDIDLTLKAQDLPVTLNKTPYHLLACRVLDAMLPKNGGAMTNSEGKKNPADGAVANWIDISGKLDGDEQGVALFNHPKNERQPTPCLQFAGQTIGLSPTHKESLTIEPGKEVRFRFRVLVHAGNVEDGKVAAEYEAYTKAGQGRIGGVERVEV
jgi:hypothetical protein